MASALVCMTLPKMTWSMSPGFTPAWRMAALDAMVPSSVADLEARAPLKVPKAVRLPERKTMSVLRPMGGVLGY